MHAFKLNSQKCVKGLSIWLNASLAPTGSFLPEGQNFEADEGGRAQTRRNKLGGSLDKISSDVLPSFGLCVCNLVFHWHPPPCFLIPSGAGLLDIYIIPGPHRSVSSHWCGFSKTHTATGRLLTKTLSRASEEGGGIGGEGGGKRKSPSIFVCLRRLGTMGISNGTAKRKREQGFRQETFGGYASLRSSHVWGGPRLVGLPLSCLYRTLRSSASKPLQLRRHKLFTFALINSRAACVMGATH